MVARARNTPLIILTDLRRNIMSSVFALISVQFVIVSGMALAPLELLNPRDTQNTTINNNGKT